MKTFLFSLLFPLFAFAADSKATTQMRDAKDFHAISVSGGFKITLVPGPYSVKIQALPNQLNSVKTTVNSGTLHIHFEAGELLNHVQKPILLEITAPVTDEIHASGVVELLGIVSPDSTFALHVSGGVDANLAGMKTTTLIIEASGGAQVKLNGTTKNLRVNASGACELDLQNLKSSTASIDGSGVVHLKVFASQELSANVSGASELEVSGNPTKRAISDAVLSHVLFR